MSGRVFVFGAAAILGLLQFSPAQAASQPSVSFCVCCGEGASQDCSAICTEKDAAGECPVTVIFGETPSATQHSLNGISLKELDLGSPSRAQLETFRKFLETERRKALTEYRKVLRAFDKRRASQEELDAAKARYEEVMVNYNHGIYAYQVSTGTEE
jgi:hypothetical protein